MKNLTLSFFFLLSGISFTSYGQTKLEFKINGYGLINKKITPSLELVFFKTIGIEFETGFDFTKTYLYEDIPGGIATKYKQTQFNPSVSLKYYFLNKMRGKGLFIGPYFRRNYLSFREDQYYIHYRARGSGNKNFDSDKGLCTRDFGITTGCKFVLNSHLILELSATITKEKHLPKRAPRIVEIVDYRYRFFSKVGYRF